MFDDTRVLINTMSAELNLATHRDLGLYRQVFDMVTTVLIAGTPPESDQPDRC